MCEKEEEDKEGGKGRRGGRFGRRYVKEEGKCEKRRGIRIKEMA